MATKQDDECTVDEFTHVSKRFAEILRTFIVAAEAGEFGGHLSSLAIFEESTVFDAFRQWEPRIVALTLPHELPVRCKPWTDHPSIEVVAPTANSCGVWLFNAVREDVFKEQPSFTNPLSEVEAYIAKNRAKLTKRVKRLAGAADFSEWITLAAKMDLERYAVSKSAEGESFPRDSFPRDEMTEKLVRALKAGTKAGKTVAEINRAFQAKHDVTNDVMNSVKRSSRNHRHLWQ